MSRLKSHPQQIRLFRSERLERLTVISPAAFFTIWSVLLPVVAWVGWGSAAPVAALGLFLAGLLGWILFEYAMHRYLFHWNPRWTPARQFVFVMHGNHHTDPNDPMRNLMPPVVSLPIAGAIWAAIVAVVGPAGSWAFLGFILGYVGYDVTHYACHQWAMKGRLAHMLKRHHMRHHYVGMDGNYAITALFLDRLFGSRIDTLKTQR